MTTVKTLTVAGLIALAPTLGFAMGCNSNKHEQQVQSCMTGSSWDSATQTCVPIASS